MTIAGVAMILTIASFLLMRQKTKTKAVDRILAEYHWADDWILRRGAGAAWQDVDGFRGRLGAIATDDAPEDVQRAFMLLLSAVEANVQFRKLGGDLEKADDEVALAKRNFLGAVEKWRGP